MRRILLASLACLLVWRPNAASPASHAAIPTHTQPNTAIAYSHTAAASPSCANDPTIGSKVWIVAISSTVALLSNQANPFLRGWFRNGNTGQFFHMPSIYH